MRTETMDPAEGHGSTWATLYQQPPVDYSNRPFDWSRLEASFDMTQDFVDAIPAGREPPVTGDDGLRAVRMVGAGHLSSQSGQAIALTPPSWGSP